MDWKDTVEPTPNSEIADYIRAAKNQQAAVSFRAGEKQGFGKGVKQGIREGIRLFAWWKDGVQYVGTCGTTLEEALKKYGGIELGG